MDNAGDAVQKVKGAGHDAAQAMDRNDARVQRKINPRWARAFGRIGYITRGVIYIIIGALAMTACWSKSSPDPDKNGVVELLASQPGGQWILWILIVGLYAYALWRLYEAISGISDDPSKKRWKRILTKRLLPIWSAVLYAYFATSVVLSLTGGGSGTSGGSGGAKKSWSSKILNAPGGIAFFIIVGIFFALSGFFQLKNAIRGKFRNQLKEWEIPLWARRLVMILGYLGYVGRAITYFLIAYLYFKVAGDRKLYDLGLGGALMELQDNAGGKVWLFLISILLICFGAFSIVLAKYKDFLKHSKVLPK